MQLVVQRTALAPIQLIFQMLGGRAVVLVCYLVSGQNGALKMEKGRILHPVALDKLKNDCAKGNIANAKIHPQRCTMCVLQKSNAFVKELGV
tara:strand:- start:6 stop:281 length:276 start_codon:yes stop_codon:yes gene_type:complete